MNFVFKMSNILTLDWFIKPEDKILIVNRVIRSRCYICIESMFKNLINYMK